MGLATLRHGFAEGTLVAGFAISLAAVTSWFLVGTFAPIAIFTVMTGIPVLLLATTLRYTGSLAASITVAGLLGAIVTIGFHLMVEDPLAWWRERLHGILAQQPQDTTSAINADITEKLDALIDILVPVMMALPAGMVFGALVILFLARWWHAVLDNPGGFGHEFHTLRLNRWLAIATIMIACMAIFIEGMTGINSEFLQILIILYLFQGLAIIHGIVGIRGMSTGWLLGSYILLILVPAIVTIFLVIIGLLDAWFDFRTRVARANSRTL